VIFEMLARINDRLYVVVLYHKPMDDANPRTSLALPLFA
jgi:hypothetical protein